MSVVDEKYTKEIPVDFSFAKLIGPGLMVAATGIGAGDMISATMGGAGYGLTLLWAVALAAFLKYFLNEGVARWQLATNTTAIEGWCTYLPWWVRAYFGLYLVVWTGFVTAALTNACGLGIENLTGGAVPRSWGAVIHSIVGCAFVMIGGFKGFEKLMKVLISVGAEADRPAPRKAAYLASSSALTFVAASGPLTASCNARQYARRNGG